MSKQNGAGEGPRFPGILTATDGTGAVVHSETNASEAAGAYPITPSTQMGEGWAVAHAAGMKNVNGRRLLFFEPEGEHAAAAVTAGMSMTGLRSTNFTSGQGVAYMHESLYAATGKRLTYVLNVAARAMTKHALNVHAGHDDYHAVDDTGFFQLFAKDVQESGDFALIAHRIAELSLNPGLNAQDGFLTSHVIETAKLAEPEMIKEYLGDPADLIESPTPAQRLTFGDKRRRIPELFSVDYPAMLGTVQNQDSYAQGVAAQRPFYFDHLTALSDQAFAEFAALTGRAYARAVGYLTEDADWILVGQGSVVPNLEVVAEYLRRERGLKVGVLNVSMFRPFPADLITKILYGAKGVTVLERCDQPLAVDAPLLREVRAAMTKGMENWRVVAAAAGNGRKKAQAPARPLPYPGLESVDPAGMPDFYSAGFGFGSRDLQPGDIIAAVDNMLPDGKHTRQFYLGIDFIRKGTRLPKLQIWQEQLLEGYPNLGDLALESAGEFNLLPEGSTALRIHSVGGWGAITMGKNIAMTAFELFGMHVKANPKYGSEKKGQPTTFYAVLAHEPIKLNAELKHVNVVLSPDGNVFRHSDPLAGMEEGGVFVIQSHEEPEQVWKALPAEARRFVREKKIKVYCLDAFGIASAEASDPELRYRMQGVAFMGAFFRCAPLAAEGGDGGGRPVRGDHRPDRGEVRQARQAGGGRQHARHPSGLRRGEGGPDRRRPRRRRGEGGAGLVHPVAHGHARRRDGYREPGSLLRAGVRGMLDRPGRDRRPVRGAVGHSGGDQHRARHDQHPLRGPRLHRGEVHRLQPVLGAVPRRGHPGARPVGGGHLRHRDPHHGERKAQRPGQADRQAPGQGVPQDPEGRAFQDVRRGGVVRLRERGRQARMGRGPARAARRGVVTGLPRPLRVPAREDDPVLRPPRVEGEGLGRHARDHDQPGGLQGLQHLRGRVPGERSGHRAAGRGDRRSPAPELEVLGAASRTPTTATSTSATSTRASACCPRCSSRRTTIARWPAATGHAWGAARRPRSTS